MTVTLPDWFTSYRTSQLSAIDEIVDAFRSGHRVVVLDAPTGSGKTLIAESVRQRIAAVNRSLYVCSTKSLQDQFMRDYPYAQLLKGRANYPTEMYPERFGLRFDSLSCEDCTKEVTKGSCLWCSEITACPYQLAKRDADLSSLAVLNTAYFLYAANLAKSFTDRALVIADECDVLDESVTGFVTISISAYRVQQLKIGTPEKVTVAESWLEWLNRAEPKVQEAARRSRERARRSQNAKVFKEAKFCSNLARQLSYLRKGLAEGGWVYTGTKDKVEFKPIWASAVGKNALWQHGQRWLLMSATVISPDQLLADLGWEDNYYSINLPSTFPASNRPIIYRPTANMRAADSAEEWPKLVPAIKAILDQHPGQRVLIHSVSYELTRYLRNELGFGLSYSESAGRERALQDFKAGVDRVLLAPSLDRGVDLPGKLCEVQIIVKVPFRYLGDRQVSARLYGQGKARGQLWYTTDAIRTLVQMCGRGVRSETDTCTTYILDQQFEFKLWGKFRRLFPEYWREALRWRQ